MQPVEGVISASMLVELARDASEGKLQGDSEVLEELDKEADRRRKQDAKESLKEWKEWAVGSAKGGGKAAHAFSRRTLSSPTPLLNESGHPVCGQEALSFLLQVWTPLWVAAGRGAHHP
eukprot:2472885-Pyramimonas_sp.AAC.1